MDYKRIEEARKIKKRIENVSYTELAEVTSKTSANINAHFLNIKRGKVPTLEVMKYLNDGMDTLGIPKIEG